MPSYIGVAGGQGIQIEELPIPIRPAVAPEILRRFALVEKRCFYQYYRGLGLCFSFEWISLIRVSGSGGGNDTARAFIFAAPVARPILASEARTLRQARGQTYYPSTNARQRLIQLGEISQARIFCRCRTLRIEVAV